jgi:threonine aldolase
VSNTHHDVTHRGFGSDNQSGVHPRVLDAIIAANLGHVGGYGNDPYTEKLGEVLAATFGAGAVGFPVFSGTGSNVVALSAVSGRWQSVICAESAHIMTDEGGAPEQSGGVKLIGVPAVDGKLEPAGVLAAIARLGTIHQSAPAAVSISQSTELGTVYRPDEIRALAAVAHDHGLVLHIDGARLPNAAAALGMTMGQLSTGPGADVVSLGGTKNGLMFGEVVVVVNSGVVNSGVADPGVTALVARARKGMAQLGSKQRFASAQLLELYGTRLWSELASHANARATELATGLSGFEHIEIAHPVEANAVFLRAPQAVCAALGERFGCQTFLVPQPLVRLMCSWDTTTSDVAAVHAVVRELAGRL